MKHAFQEFTCDLGHTPKMHTPGTHGITRSQWQIMSKKKKKSPFLYDG